MNAIVHGDALVHRQVPWATRSPVRLLRNIGMCVTIRSCARAVQFGTMQAQSPRSLIQVSVGHRPGSTSAD